MAIRVAINGFGRIGRLVFRVLHSRGSAFEVVAINDLASAEVLAMLLKFDSVHGQCAANISADKENIIVDGKKIPVLSVKSPKDLPWKDKKVYFVVESTGIFRSRASDKGGYGDHIAAGAQKVVLTVPAKDKVDATIVLGVNDKMLKAEHKCISNASCTTNCLAPVAKVLNDTFGIQYGLMTTCHAYTNDQVVCDQIHREDVRRARAAAVNIIPTSTGAAKALGEVIPELEGKLHGLALRVPVVCGSIVDLVTWCDKKPSPEAINDAVKKAAEGPMKGILVYSTDPLVSSDVIHNPASSILDSAQTMVKGNLVKVLSWYDNEWAYSNRVADLMQKAAAL